MIDALLRVLGTLFLASNCRQLKYYCMQPLVIISDLKQWFAQEGYSKGYSKGYAEMLYLCGLEVLLVYSVYIYKDNIK